MNVVDSSGWIEYFTGPDDDLFATAIKDTGALIVPTITTYEVFKWVCRNQGEDDALRVMALMRRGRIVDLDARLAIDAARISAALGLAMGDSIILATARRYDATLWTQDAHFAGIDGVRCLAKS